MPERLSREELSRTLAAVRALSHAGALEGPAAAAGELIAILREAMESDVCGIYLLDDEHTELVLLRCLPDHPLAVKYARLPAEGTLTGAAALESLGPQVVVVADLPRGRDELMEWGFTHMLHVPLHAQGRPFGMLKIVRKTGRPFSDGEIVMGEILASQAMIQLENARLYEAGQRRLGELSVLVEVARSVTASLDLTTTLDGSAEMLPRLVGASNAHILLLDEDRRTLRSVATSDPVNRPHFLGITLDVGDTAVTARCVRERRPIAVEDAEQATEVSRALVARFGQKSLLALPLLARGEPIGAVLLDDTRTPRRWSRDEIARVELIVHPIAAAVANARLFADLKQSYAELGRAQDALVGRERLAALGELAAIMAHEVRNPLGVIFNSLATLERIVPLEGDASILFRILREEADRLNGLIDELLDFARPREPALAEEQVKPLVESAVEAATHDVEARGIEVRVEIGPDVPVVRLDARMVRRAIVNLVVNALEAMPQGGKLTATVRPELRAGCSGVRIDVADTGHGVAKADVPRIFQPFFTTKAKGTGLGLAVVRNIALAHRGGVSVESEPDTGATFSLWLPQG